MSPAPLAPAELAALEHAFASEPSSEAYRPLSEAYLAMNRFMEAMVVCKKGVKAHPTDPAPRVLLARVYAAQGKDRKALTEVAEALGVKPDDAAANRLAGVLHLKLGEKDAGVEALRRAFRAAPGAPETLEAMRKWGVAPEPEKPAATQTTAVSPTATGTATPTSVARSAAPATPGAATTSAAATASAAAAEPAIDIPLATPPPVLRPPAPGASEPLPGAAPAAPARNTAYSDELAERYATREYGLGQPGPAGAPRPKRSSTALIATLGLGAAFLVVLGVYFGVSSAQKARALEIDRLLRQTRELLEKDGYASYKEAAKLCERILERDPDAVGGHAYLAYIDAIRWGEHGESESLRDEARAHLAAVNRVGRTHSHAYAADAYLRYHGGESQAALEALRKLIAGPEGASALLRGVAGILEMQSGDLDVAREDLTLARTRAPGDVRVTQMLAEQYRRRGQSFEALASGLYDTALTRLAPDHVPSLLGKARLLLDAGRPDEAAKRVQRVLELGAAASPRQAALATALRSSILHAQGKSGEGDAAEGQALAQDPANPDIHDIVGRRKLASGDAAGAVEAFQKALLLDPARLAFHADLGAALLQRPGGTKQAVAALEKATERVANPRLSKMLGDAYRVDGDLERARGAYEKAIAGEKRFPEARLGLARVWRDRKEWDKALEELNGAAKELGDSGAPGAAAAAWVEIADTEEQRGGAFEAVENAYRAALRVDPQSCPALFWLGRSRSEKRTRLYDRPLAAQMLSDYLRLCPRGPRASEAQRIVAGLRR